MTRIAVVVGSTRTGRKGAEVGRWVLDEARRRLPSHVDVELVDLAGFVGYGVHAGGAVAIEQLRVVLAELAVAGVRTTTRLQLGVDTAPDGAVRPAERQERSLDVMLRELVAWSEALRTIRVGVPA